MPDPKPKTKVEKEGVMRAKLQRLWSNAREQRRRLDWRWFIYDLWVLGEHYTRYDRNTQQIYTQVRERGKPRVTVNKIYSTLRAIRNYTVRNKPRAESVPVDIDPENIKEARNVNKLMDYWHERLQLRFKLKASVWHALKYSIGFWQVLWDEDANDGAGEIVVNVVDPFDLYIDPVATDPSNARYIIMAVRRSVEDIQNDPKYDHKETAKIKGDNKIAASDLKARLVRHERGTPMVSEDEEATAIVKEYWLKEQEGPEDIPRIRIVTMAENYIIRDELTDLWQMPFFKLPSDINPLQMYGIGWVRNMVPLNRQLNRLESQLAEYNDLMNRGRFVMDKGAGVRVIYNENGQIIEKKRGYNVTQQAITPLSSAIYNQIANHIVYIEDMGGAHDASLGRIPTGAQSGVAIEALQLGDANNLAELTENMENFLENVYEYMLAMAATKYQFARNITPMTQSGEREVVRVIGEEAITLEGEEEPPEDTTVIRKKNIVDVKMTSWLANTGFVRREILKELYQLGVIDQQTLLEGYQIGSVADIIERTKKEAAEEQGQRVEEEGQTAEATAQAQQEPGPDATQVQQQSIQAAAAAIRTIAAGGEPDLPDVVPQAFVDFIDQFLQSGDAEAFGGDVLQRIQAFREKAAQRIG